MATHSPLDGAGDVEELLVVEELRVELLVGVLLAHAGAAARRADGERALELQRQLPRPPAARGVLANHVTRVELGDVPPGKRITKNSNNFKSFRQFAEPLRHN